MIESAPARERERSPRLLVVAYYFPPSGGAGVQRVLKWVKYLPEAGIEPIVLTVRDGAYPQYDPSLQEDVPPGVQVVRARAFDPLRIYARLIGQSREAAVARYTDDVGKGEGLAERVARWVRANVFIPDGRVGWVPFAAVRAQRLEDGFDVILTSGPPHSAHLVGRMLSRPDIPWIADFRDPWTDIHYLDNLPRGRAARAIDRRLERTVLRSADLVTTVSPSWASLLGSRRGRPVEVIHNGFDPADFAAPEPEAESGRFVVAHVGSLYGSRNPVAFWEAVARLKSRGEAPHLRVRVVGRTGEEVREAAHSHGIDVEWIDYVPHAEAIDQMRRASLLLLSTEPHRHEAGHLTGKVYEYLASGTPVLALGAPGGDAEDLLRKTGGGALFARDDADGIARYLRAAYQEWVQSDGLTGARAEAIAPYSRREQAHQLARLVHGLLADQT